MADEDQDITFLLAKLNWKVGLISVDKGAS